jgi:hypothetical protein
MLFNDKLRHRCRNPRCRANLKQTTDNPRRAFCCAGCFEGFYRLYCAVCEEPIRRTSPTQKLCGRRKCRREYSRDPARFSSPWEGTPREHESSSKNPTETKAFWAIESGRGWCWESVGEQHHLIARDGRLAARLVPEDTGFWIAYPHVRPELPIYPDLNSAKRAIINVVLWALPPDRTMATKLRMTNARQRVPRPEPSPVTSNRNCDFHSPPQPGAAATSDKDGLNIPEFLSRRTRP